MNPNTYTVYLGVTQYLCKIISDNQLQSQASMSDIDNSDFWTDVFCSLGEGSCHVCLVLDFCIYNISGKIVWLPFIYEAIYIAWLSIRIECFPKKLMVI